MQHYIGYFCCLHIPTDQIIADNIRVEFDYRDAKEFDLKMTGQSMILAQKYTTQHRRSECKSMISDTPLVKDKMR